MYFSSRTPSLSGRHYINTLGTTNMCSTSSRDLRSAFYTHTHPRSTSPAHISLQRNGTGHERTSALQGGPHRCVLALALHTADSVSHASLYCTQATRFRDRRRPTTTRRRLTPTRWPSMAASSSRRSSSPSTPTCAAACAMPSPRATRYVDSLSAVVHAS